MLKLRINPLAIEDMQRIKVYITEELCNPDAAQRTVESIFSVCQRLKGMPLMGKKLSAVINIETDLRYLISGSFLIFYRTA